MQTFPIVFPKIWEIREIIINGYELILKYKNKYVLENNTIYIFLYHYL